MSDRPERAELRRVSREAAAHYDLLAMREPGKPKRLSGVLMAEYRCERARCLLLHVYQTPVGPAYHKPRYRLSPALNEQRSSAEGRAANTEDGDHKWKRTDGLLDDAWNLALNCDHVEQHVVGLADLVTGPPGSAALTLI